MRLARFLHHDVEVLGAFVDDSVVPLPGAASVLEPPPETPDGPALPLADVRLLAPIPRPPKFLAAGPNETVTP